MNSRIAKETGERGISLGPSMALAPDFRRGRLSGRLRRADRLSCRSVEPEASRENLLHRTNKKTTRFGVVFLFVWRRKRDSNPRYAFGRMLP